MHKRYVNYVEVLSLVVVKRINKVLGITGVYLFVLMAGASDLLAQHGQVPEGFTPIFNGEDLTGWHISKTSHHGTVGNFFVKDGAIVMKQYPYGQGGIILTDKKYGDFELYFEFRGDSGTNGGVFLRSNESGSAYQLEISGDGEAGTGNLIGEMLRTTIQAQATDLDKVWHKGRWNTFHLRIVGAKPHATLWVNGMQMWEVQAERNDLIADVREGMIALQLHWSSTLLPVPGGRCCDYSWRPGAAHAYRNIAIKEL